MTIFLRTASVLLLMTVPLAARQAPQQEAVATFEVASVKPGGSSGRGSLPSSQPNGGFSATNVALKSIIANAYEIRVFQIEGDPAWLTSERFDILAKGREGTPDRLRPEMLRALLADRFKLVAHFETREQQVYALVPLRADGRLGPHLKPSAPQPNPAASASGFPMASVSGGLARISGSRVTLDNFATVLTSSLFGQRVINRTGLTGEFDLDVQFAPDSAVNQRTSELPSIFAAVQEQLGLRLQSERGEVPFLIIDSVQRPTPD